MKGFVKEFIASSQHLEQFQQALARNTETASLLAELPRKLRHTVCVPLGPHAFFPGELVHTNEILLDLGQGYLAQCSASHAEGVLARQRALLERQLAQCGAQLADLGLGRLGGAAGSIAPGEEEEGLLEIRETLEEADAWAQAAITATATATARAATAAGREPAATADATAAVGVRGASAGDMPPPSEGRAASASVEGSAGGSGQQEVHAGPRTGSAPLPPHRPRLDEDPELDALFVMMDRMEELEARAEEEEEGSELIRAHMRV